MLFNCRVMTKKGENLSLIKEGSNLTQIARELVQEGFYVINIKSSSETKGKKRNLSHAQLLVFFQTLEVLLSQNLSLKEAFDILISVHEQGILSLLIQDLRADLHKGASLHQALSQSGIVFPPLVIGLIRVGELTGSLKKVVTQLTQFLTQKARLREKILGALIYPILILFVAFIGMILLSTFILPSFVQLAESLKHGSANQLQNQLLTFQIISISVFTLFVSISVFIFFLSRDPNSKLRLFIDKTSLFIPVYHKIAMNLQLQNLVLSLSILLQSGYTFDRALDESERVISNRFLAKSLKRIQGQVEKGSSFTLALKNESIFPKNFRTWIQVGESSHDLKKTLIYLEGYYQTEVDKTMNKMMALIEPSLILLVGIFLFFVIFNFIGPVFQLMGNSI